MVDLRAERIALLPLAQRAALCPGSPGKQGGFWPAAIIGSEIDARGGLHL